MHTKYQHGGDIYSNKVSIDYSANINPLGLPQGVKEELARCIEEPVCCVYPDSQCRDLVKALADYHKVTQDWILCGDGAADLIFGLAFALKPKKALLLAPSFLEYEQALKAVDCDIDLFYLKEENGYRLDVEELCKTLERANATYNTTAVGCSDQQKSTSEANNGYDILFLCNPNNPTKSRIYQAELMTGYTDRKYPFQTEIPLRIRIEERKNETTTGGIYVDRNVITCFGVVSIESFVQCFNVIVQSCPCNTLDRYNTDSVFITHLQRFFGVESGLFKSQRHFTHFDLPQLRELFPYNLETC